MPDTFLKAIQADYAAAVSLLAPYGIQVGTQQEKLQRAVVVNGDSRAVNVDLNGAFTSSWMKLAFDQAGMDNNWTSFAISGQTCTSVNNAMAANEFSFFDGQTSGTKIALNECGGDDLIGSSPQSGYQIVNLLTSYSQQLVTRYGGALLGDGTVNQAGTSTTSPSPVAVVLTTVPPATTVTGNSEMERLTLNASLEASYATPSCLGVSYNSSGTAMITTTQSNTCIQAGMSVSGTGIPLGTLVKLGSGTSYTLTNSIPTASGAIANFNGPFAYASALADFALDPYLQPAILVSTNLKACLPDGTHYSALCQQEISSRAACALERAQGLRSPCWINMGPIPFDTLALYKSTTQKINLYQLEPHEQVCGVKYSNDPNQNSGNASFSGGYTALTLSVGDSGGAATAYMPAKSMSATGTNYFANSISSFSPAGFVSSRGMVQGTFTATGGNLSTSSQGAYSLSVCVQLVN